MSDCWKNLYLKIEASLLFNSNLSRHPFLGQEVNLDLLCCSVALDSICNMLICFYQILCLIFVQRPINDRKIQWSNELLLWSVTSFCWFEVISKKKFITGTGFPAATDLRGFLILSVTIIIIFVLASVKSTLAGPGFSCPRARKNSTVVCYWACVLPLNSHHDRY